MSAWAWWGSPGAFARTSWPSACQSRGCNLSYNSSLGCRVPSPLSGRYCPWRSYSCLACRAWPGWSSLGFAGSAGTAADMKFKIEDWILWSAPWASGWKSLTHSSACSSPSGTQRCAPGRRAFFDKHWALTWPKFLGWAPLMSSVRRPRCPYWEKCEFSGAGITSPIFAVLWSKDLGSYPSGTFGL